MDRTSTTPIDMSGDGLLQQRAEAVAAFKARANLRSSNRSARTAQIQLVVATPAVECVWSS